VAPTKKNQPKATQLVREKFTTNTGLVREVIIWSIPKNQDYPEGLKYRLILVEATSGKVLTLYDNHPPKGHHKHLEGIESKNEFISLEILIREFLDSCRKWENHYESKKNSN
jgi:hypothetical protein